MALSTADIKTLYLNVLQRDASDAEALAWSTASQDQLTNAQVRAGIEGSAEATTFVNPVVRLYEAAFGRVPDKGGFDVNVDALHAAHGDVYALANAFVGSPEFATRYNNGTPVSGTAAPTDAIIKALYLNALGRAGSDAEVASWKASGQTVSQILVGFSESPESIALTKTALSNFLDAAGQGTASYTGPLITIPHTVPTDGGGGTPQGTVFTLTSSDDIFLGQGGNDTINGTAATLSATDIIDGGAGTDILNLTSTGLGAFTVPTVSVTNVETANLSSDSTLSVDTRTWTGLTNLNATATASSTIKAGATTAVTLEDTLGNGNIVINGGSSINVNAHGVYYGNISVGGTTAPTGTINISATTLAATAADYTAGDITVTGGTKVNISQTTANTPYIHTQTNGMVTVNGTSATAEVSVSNAIARAGGSGAGAVATNTVAVYDIAAGSASSSVGKISKISVDGYTVVGIQDNALTDLSLAHGSGNMIIDNSSALAANARTTTLNLTVDALTGGTLDDADIYTTLNITTTGSDARLANITFGALTTLTIGGTKNFTQTSGAGFTALQTVTVTGQAGYTANLAPAGTVRTVDTSATTGTSTLTINGSQATFTGGAGVDAITLNNAATKAVSLGGGDDSLVLGSLVPTASLDGGTGIDTLSMDATAAATASGSGTFANNVTGFEHLILTGAANQTIDLAALGNYAYVQTQGANGLTLNNMPSTGTLVLAGAGTAYTIANSAFTAGANDTVNVVLTSASGAAVGFATTGLTANGVENINVTTVDAQATPSGTFNDTLGLLGNSSHAITVSGTAGLTLTAASTALTNVDASGITIGGFNWTSGALANAATIKGSATGANTIDVSASSNAVTYTGGSGVDTITVGNQAAHNLTGAGGVDHFVFATPNASALAGMTTITDYRAAGGSNAGAADVIDILGITTVASNVSTVQNLSAQASVASCLNILASVATTNNGLSVFIYGGDTYVYVEHTGASNTYAAGDTVIKLQGTPFVAGTSIYGLGIDGV